MAENPTRDKYEYFKENHVGERPNGNCYACEEAINRVPLEDSNPCDYCPLGRFTGHGCLGGLFKEWRGAKGNNELRTKLALQIANLEWRD